MINKHIGIYDCWCKNELFYKGNSFWGFFLFFFKGGAHAPVATALGLPSGNQISVSKTALLSGLDVDFALNAPTQQNQNSEYDIEIMTDCRV